MLLFYRNISYKIKKYVKNLLKKSYFHYFYFFITYYAFKNRTHAMKIVKYRSMQYISKNDKICKIELNIFIVFGLFRKKTWKCI